MEIKINIPAYDPYEGIRISWVGNHEILITLEDDEIVIRANKDGLATLATQMLTLAQESIPSRHHIHLTDVSGLDEGSLDLRIDKA